MWDYINVYWKHKLNSIPTLKMFKIVEAPIISYAKEMYGLTVKVDGIERNNVNSCILSNLF